MQNGVLASQLKQNNRPACSTEHTGYDSSHRLYSHTVPASSIRAPLGQTGHEDITASSAELRHRGERAHARSASGAGHHRGVHLSEGPFSLCTSSGQAAYPRGRRRPGLDEPQGLRFRVEARLTSTTHHSPRRCAVAASLDGMIRAAWTRSTYSGRKESMACCPLRDSVRLQARPCWHSHVCQGLGQVVWLVVRSPAAARSA